MDRIGISLLLTMIIAVGMLVPDAVRAQSQAPEAILMIGNSLTRGIGRNLKRLFRDAGHSVRVRSRAPRGFELLDHLHKRATLRKITSRAWDIVILQEQSDGIFDERYPAARELDARIVANGSSTMFFMTWRRRGEAPAAYDDLRGVVGGSVGYVPIAFELGAPIAPIGWAFRETVVDGAGGSLWRDAVHANKRGRYLAACVFYATILVQSPVGNGYQPRSIGVVDALTLQQLASDTVLNDPGQWNVGLPLFGQDVQ